MRYNDRDITYAKRTWRFCATIIRANYTRIFDLLIRVLRCIIAENDIRPGKAIRLDNVTQFRGESNWRLTLGRWNYWRDYFAEKREEKLRTPSGVITDRPWHELTQGDRVRWLYIDPDAKITNAADSKRFLIKNEGVVFWRSTSKPSPSRYCTLAPFIYRQILKRSF